MKIFLVRHGETTGDIEDRYGGSYDDPMTELGRSQLKKTAAKLVDKEIEIIFASPLIRTAESAEIVSSEIKAPVEFKEGLRERSYGILGGLTKKEALEKYPKEVETYKNPLETVSEGESFQDFQERVVTTFKDLTVTPYKTIAIISHGGPIKRILAYLEKPIPEKLGDGEIIEIEL